MNPFADNPSQSGYSEQILEPPESHQYGQNVSTINMHSDLEADVVIRPQTRSVSLLQFARGPHLVAAGREAVEQSLPALRETFPWL